MQPIAVEVLIEHPQWEKLDLPITQLVDRIRQTVQEDSHRKRDGGAVCLVLSTDKEVHILNRDFRNKDKSTDVLSFPLEEPGMLGDVILAYETIEKDAQSQNKSLQDHTLHLILHGILHLLGYDHETEDDATIMEALEIKILMPFGIKNPYLLS